MKKQDMHKVLQRGSLMVEALALLGLITMVTPVMYKKAAERTTELQDINIATQMRTLNEALDNYVRNNYEKVKAIVSVDAPTIVSATDSSDDIVKGVNAYLPAGFNLSQSKYFDANNLKFSIKREDDTDMTGKTRSVYTTAVLAPSLNPITFNRASKIASMIGINGGTIKEDKFVGAQGAWRANPQEWFEVPSTDLKTGSLMSISNEAIAESATADASKLLYRVNDDDSVKNTMETNLIMGSHDIQEINALFGQGGELTIGSDDSNNLVVKGAANISSALEVAGKATLKDELEVTKATTLKSTLGVTGATTLNSTLDVTGATTLDSTLKVTGDTTLANTSVEGTLGVTGATTLESTLKVTGATTLESTLDVTGATTLTSLAVINDATVGGDLTIEGTLISNKLHAKTKLTVGGDTPDSPSVMKVDSNIFNVNSDKASFNGSEFNVNIANSAGSQLSMTENQTLLKNPTGNVFMELSHDPDDKTFARLGSNAGEFISDATSNSISMKTDDTQFIIKKSGAPVAQLKHNGKDRLAINSGDTYIESGNNNDMYTKLFLSPETFGFSKNSTDSTDTTASLFLDASNKLTVDSDNFELNTDKFRVGAADFFLDNGGLAIGENLTDSGGNRDNPITNPLTPQSNQKVIISRNGYIELAPPSDYGTSGANDGTKAGFIRARRLVSDIPYYDHPHFDGATYDGYDVEHPYDYYQVNPAYTSIMNDIKLASRGGARLSDILSDYIIKGIYVGDNTYHAGYSEDEGFNIQNEWVSGLNSDALIWDVIPIEKGAVKDGVIKANDDTGNTSCAPTDQTGDTPNPNCKIYSCQNADCVASPWLGFVPKPQCPEHYLAVVTNNPIRWRMSEVYYLSDIGDDQDNDLEDISDEKKYNIIIKDLKSQMDESDTPPTADERFSYYFKKHHNPKEAFFSIKEESATTTAPHKHKTSATPITFQTNTWLNSSVSPHSSSDGSVDGWHILMGFLYKPNDYTDLLDDTGLDGADPDALHWNIFPVYAHEMASIVTTYCAFAPTAGNRWDSDNIESPVLNYNQLNSNTFRDPNTLNREPVNGAGKGEGWAKQVNDPSLPYDDAW